jgi:hypothetical protein
LSGGGQFSLFDEPGAFDSLVGGVSERVLISLSLEFSSIMGESKLRDFAAERHWFDNGRDFDRCFLTCRPSFSPRGILLSRSLFEPFTPVWISY